MSVFLPMLLNLLPLYVLIGLGYIAGRWLQVNLPSIARINIFILLPVVMVGAMARMEFDPQYLLLPVLLWLISLCAVFLSYRVGKLFWQDGNANLLGAGSANGNTIYFGLTPILLLFGPAGVGIYLFMNLGPQVNNLTLAYFLAARGHHTLRQSLKKTLRFPAVHAAWIGLLCNFLGWTPEGIVLKYWEHATGAIVWLGMMMIGIALGKFEKLEIDFRLLGAFVLSKFGLWPALCGLFVWLDVTFLGLFERDIHKMILLFSVMPVMGNLVAYATEHDLHPQRAATVVLITTLLTLFTVPGVLMLFE